MEPNRTSNQMPRRTMPTFPQKQGKNFSLNLGQNVMYFELIYIGRGI